VPGTRESTSIAENSVLTTHFYAPCHSSPILLGPVIGARAEAVRDAGMFPPCLPTKVLPYQP
jgi:hypothetical protein